MDRENEFEEMLSNYTMNGYDSYNESTQNSERQNDIEQNMSRITDAVTTRMILHDIRKLDRPLSEARRKNIITTAMVGLGAVGLAVGVHFANVNAGAIDEFGKIARNAIEAVRTGMPMAKDLFPISKELQGLVVSGMLQVASAITIGKGIIKGNKADKEYRNLEREQDRMYSEAYQISPELVSEEIIRTSRGGR